MRMTSSRNTIRIRVGLYDRALRRAVIEEDAPHGGRNARDERLRSADRSY